jgi:hypothetical protein
MSQNEIVYLKYQNLEDMLKVIIYSAQSMIGVIPMLYYIHYNNKHVLFIQTGAVGGVTIHYGVENEKPTKKFIQLKRLSGEFTFVYSIGTDAQSLYVPILGLEKYTLAIPTLEEEKVLGKGNIDFLSNPENHPERQDRQMKFQRMTLVLFCKRSGILRAIRS